MPEPLPSILRYVVIAGQDAGRVGVAVGALEMEELIGGPWAALLDALRLRRRSRWRATWLVLEFAEGGSRCLSPR